MMRVLSTLILFLCVGLAPAQEQVGKSKWPSAPPPKQEVTPPTAVYTVKLDEWFLIERDTPAIALSSPGGFLEVSYRTNKEGCPIIMMGKFAGGGGKVEEKEVKSKYIIQLKPLRTGRCEVLIVPHGVTKEADIERKTVDVDAGGGAQPPPGGGEPPVIVDPPVGTPVKGFFMVVRKDGPMETSFDKVMRLAAWKQLTDAGHTVKEYTLTESLKFYKPITNPPIPFVVILSPTIAGKVYADPVALLTTDDGILKLKDAVK